MLIVVDANPLISLLIKPSRVIELLFRDDIELFAPTLLFDEIQRNLGIIIAKSSLDEKEIEEFIVILKGRIKIISEEEFLKFRKKAEEICPDEKDVTYFALAIYLNCPIWSNEKKLKEQTEIRIYSTYELLELFDML